MYLFWGQAMATTNTLSYYNDTAYSIFPRTFNTVRAFHVYTRAINHFNR